MGVWVIGFRPFGWRFVAVGGGYMLGGLDSGIDSG